MNKCLRITVQGVLPNGFMRTVVQKYAKKFDLEGTAQRLSGADQAVKIVVCGRKETVDEFVDALYKGIVKVDVDYIDVEPFFKEKDYRGVFRVIE